MKLLVIQHSANENSGLFGDLFRADGHEVTTFHPYAQPDAPELIGFDALWVLGGAMNVWQAPEIPWLAAEIDLIRRAVLDRAMPYFGICLGHQLLGHVLGATVTPAARSEVGLLPVERVGNGGELEGLPASFTCFHWHEAQVQSLPDGARLTARSVDCAIQGMAWGDTASSVQFHPEVSRAVLNGWFEEKSWITLYDELQGKDASLHLRDRAGAMEAELRHLSGQLYRNWMARHFG